MTDIPWTRCPDCGDVLTQLQPQCSCEVELPGMTLPELWAILTEGRPAPRST